MNKVDDDELAEYFPPATDAGSDFNEHGYLSANPDVAELVRQGKMPSGMFHYLKHGKREGRPRMPDGTASENRALDTKYKVPPACDPCNIDTLICTRAGAFFIAGWAEESSAKIRQIKVNFHGTSLDIPA